MRLKKMYFALAVVPSLLMADVSYQNVEELIAKGDFERACPLIEKLYQHSPNDFKLNLYYGQCAAHKGNTDQAMIALDRAELLEDQNATVHQYLGDFYAKLGSVEIAKDEYDEAERLGIGFVKRREVQNYKTNRFAVSVQLDGGYDSNVEYIAEASEINDWLGGSTYTGKPKTDTFTREYLNFIHVYDDDPYTPFYYKNQLYIYNKNYNKYVEDDFAQGEMLTGPGFAFQSLDVWLPVSYTWLMTNYTDYAAVYSFKPQIKRVFENDILLKIDGKYEYQQYLQWEDGNKKVMGAEVGLSRWYGINYVGASYRYEKAKKQDADSPRLFLDKTMHEAELNYFLKLTDSLKFGAGYLYSKVFYEDILWTGTGDKREDTLKKFSASLMYKITGPIGISLQYAHYNNTSNYLPADYTKEVITAGLYLHY